MQPVSSQSSGATPVWSRAEGAEGQGTGRTQGKLSLPARTWQGRLGLSPPRARLAGSWLRMQIRTVSK